MIPSVEIHIDEQSGFCFGVVNAISRAEELLDKGIKLYCLGDIVHNTSEVERLRRRGLITIDHTQFATLHHATVLLRAHGEPPDTYRIARQNDIEIIDATCPVVLRLQRKIRTTYDTQQESPQIVIYGKAGHAEVNGLVGQTDGKALVVEKESDIDSIDFSRPVALFAQTTKSLDGFRSMVSAIESRSHAAFEHYDTVCRQVANRIPHIRLFAANNDVILLVSGKKSSNGRILFEECRHINPRSYFIDSVDEIRCEWFDAASSIGICGATSTPLWQMQTVKKHLLDICEINK